MRKNSLRQAANIYLTSNQGSHRYKKYRRYVILKMINDLFITGKVPTHWKAINATHLQLLVTHWQKQRLQPTTIMNYMTIIRKFLLSVNNCTTNIDNQNLGITVNKVPRKPIKIPLEQWQKIQCPVVRLLLNLQIYFGLTLSEAMRIMPSVHVRGHQIFITREIAFNSQDRVIPIRTEAQRNIIDEFNLGLSRISG